MREATPGPWSFRLYSMTDEHIAEARSVGLTPPRLLTNDGAAPVMGPNGRIALVDCQTKYKRGEGYKAECAERDANAQLIVRAVNERDELLAALKATSGYLINAKIDLETGASKRTAIQTIEGGLDVVRAALDKAESPNA